MSQDWRDWISKLSPERKRQLRERLHVTASAMSQWTTGNKNPGKPMIRLLARIEPDITESLQLDFPDAFRDRLDDPSELHIPPAYMLDVITDRATVAEYVAQYAITNKVFEQIVSQLDPHGDGLMILPAMCKPDQHGMITSLQITSGYGTGPWRFKQIECSYEVGLDSLSGEAVRRLHPVIYPYQHILARNTAALGLDLVESAGAFPILFHGKVAGALFIGSVFANFFSQPRRDLGEWYGYLYALGLSEHQFYTPDRVTLQVIAEGYLEHGKGIQKEGNDHVGRKH